MFLHRVLAWRAAGAAEAWAATVGGRMPSESENTVRLKQKKREEIIIICNERNDHWQVEIIQSETHQVSVKELSCFLHLLKITDHQRLRWPVTNVCVDLESAAY